jgi:enoyl-CoA hydratase
VNDSILYEREGEVSFITLNRPHVLNAINDDWLEGLAISARRASEDAGVRVLVLRGNGRAFCAGADLKEGQHRQDLKKYRARRIRLQEEIPLLLRRLDIPVLAQVHGYALGGGCELAMLADMRIAGQSAKFGFPEVRVGATVTMGGLYNLVRMIGLGRAFELVYLARMVDAEEACHIGLVNSVVPDETLTEAIAAVAREIGSQFPLELALTRAAMYRGLDVDFATAVNNEAASALVSYMGGARQTGMAGAMKQIGTRTSKRGA